MESASCRDHRRNASQPLSCSQMSVATCAPHAAKGSDPTRSDNPSSTTEWPDKPPLVSKRTRLEGNNNEPRQRLIMRLEPQGVHEHHIEMRVHRGNFFAAWKKLLSWRPMYANSGGPKSSFAPVEKYDKCHEAVGSGSSAIVHLSQDGGK